MSARLRVAVAGAGFAGGLHLAGWKRLSEVEVVAICDPDESKARARAKEFGIPRVFADAGAMLQQTSPDALDIVAPLGAHAPLCLLAAEHGIDVLCQKPLAGSAGEAADLARAVGGRIRLMVHENWRFRAHYRIVKGWLDEGLVGRPVSASMRVRSSGLIPDERGVRAQLVRQPFLAELPRFLIAESLIHQLDVLRWLLGPWRVEAARIGRTCPVVKGEDRALIVLAADERWAVVDGNYAVAGAPATASDTLELIGNEGVVQLEGDVLTANGKRRESRQLDLVGDYPASYAAAIAHFAHALMTGSPFETDVEDNLQTLRLVDAAYALAQPLADG